MTKILWADDQTDVIKTFSSVLTPLTLDITFVKDGSDALAKLKSHNFDILLLDLMMPPEKWGGLWLLEEIKKNQIKVPVIVISGEGTQPETIKALRLGAQDYVLKDKVQTELLESVKKVIQESEAQIKIKIQNNSPTLISLPYKRYITTTEPISRLHRLFEFFESCLRLCCIIGICEGKNSLNGMNYSDQFRSIIQPPSMGSWNQTRQFISKFLSKETAFYQINSSFDNGFLSSIIQLRNDIAHGTEPSERQAIEHLNNIETHLKSFVKKLWQNLNFEIVMPTKFRFDGNLFEIDGILLTGESSTLPKFKTTLAAPLICDQPYLRVIANNSWVNLSPFLVAEEANEPLTWHIMFFDGIKIDRNKNPLGDELLRYIDARSGQRNIIPTKKYTSDLLPSFMTGLHV
ncbi:MAG: response regulator [Chloroflexota bacterium]